MQEGSSREILGFNIVGLVDDDQYCLIVTNNLGVHKFVLDGIDLFKENYLETLNDLDDLKIRNASLKLEEEIKWTINE